MNLVKETCASKDHQLCLCQFALDPEIACIFLIEPHGLLWHVIA